jgi:hypothetical protein
VDTLFRVFESETIYLGLQAGTQEAIKIRIGEEGEEEEKEMKTRRGRSAQFGGRRVQNYSIILLAYSLQQERVYRAVA